MVHDQIRTAWQTRWTIGKFKDPDGVVEKLSRAGKSIAELKALMPDRFIEAPVIQGNLALNEGIAELLLLLTGGTATAYNNTNARIGVGDSSTAESASQTGLQAATNKLWKAMDATYPTIASQTVTFKSTFGTSEANFAWNEFTVVNASDDTGDNLNRKVSAKGTKVSGETWIAQVDITVS